MKLRMAGLTSPVKNDGEGNTSEYACKSRLTELEIQLKLFFCTCCINMNICME